MLKKSILLLMLITITVILVHLLPLVVNGENKLQETKCLLVLTPNTWHLLGLEDINATSMSITIVSGGTALRIIIPELNRTWSILQGNFLDRTLFYISNSTVYVQANGFRIQGYLSDVLSNIVSTSKISNVRIITRHVKLNPNSTYTMELFSRIGEVIDRTGKGIVLELWVENSTSSLASIIARIATDKGKYIQPLPLPKTGSIQASIQFSPLILIGYHNITRISLELRAGNKGFNAIVTVAAYILEYTIPQIQVKTPTASYACRVYVDLVPPLHLTALSSAIRKYTSKLIRDIPVPSPNIEVGDILGFKHSYKVSMRVVSKEKLEKWNMSKLVDGLKMVFGGTNISFTWNTSVTLRVLEVRLRDVDYAIRVNNLYLNYTPKPIHGGIPICGDGIVGLCMVSYLNRLSGGTVAIQLLQPGLSYTGKAQWNMFPWGVDVGSSGYTPRLQDVIYNPITITQVYLGYPFSSLSPTLTAYWFTDTITGRVVSLELGSYNNIPVAYLKVKGSNYTAELVVDTYYLIPLKAIFNGTSSSWRIVGLNYNAYYDLELVEYKGFWRNIRSYMVPLSITLKNNYTYRGYLIVTQPGLDSLNLVYNNSKGTITLRVNPRAPVRIMLIGKNSFIRGLGELFTLSLIGTVKILAPTRLLLVQGDYGEVLVFHTYYPLNASISIVLVGGKYWYVKNVSIGKPVPLLSNKLNIELGIKYLTNTTKTMKPTLKPVTSSMDKAIIVGIASIALMATALIVHYVRTMRRRRGIGSK